jgi:hypothetical protein
VMVTSVPWQLRSTTAVLPKVTVPLD